MANMRHRQWSDLPPELVTDIAERLGLLEVVRFRSVCQSWNSASSTMSAKIESTLSYEPWFLHYGYDSAGQCQLLTAENGNITMNLPELDETTTCIASYQGWLLVFKQGGSMFFFRPFSKTKIDLPKFSKSELTNHLATFTCPPTSADCTVCLISRSAINDQLELDLLRRGCTDWFQHKIKLPRSSINTIKCAAYSKIGEFYFLDHGFNLLTLSVTENREIIWENDEVVESTDNSPGNFCTLMRYFEKADMMNKLGLADLHEDVSFSVCGTQTEERGIDKFICNEIYEKISKHDKRQQRKFKGVWIHPTFYQIPPKEQSCFIEACFQSVAKTDVPRSFIDTIKCAAYSKVGEFYFLDHGDNLLTLSVTAITTNQEIRWKTFKVVDSNDNSPGTFHSRPRYFEKADLMNKLGLADLHEDISFTVCGTQTEHDGIDKLIYNEIYKKISNHDEKISNHDEESKSQLRNFKGVWIRPTLNQISPKEQSW